MNPFATGESAVTETTTELVGSPLGTPLYRAPCGPVPAICTFAVTACRKAAARAAARVVRAVRVERHVRLVTPEVADQVDDEVTSSTRVQHDVLARTDGHDRDVGQRLARSFDVERRAGARNGLPRGTDLHVAGSGRADDGDVEDHGGPPRLETEAHRVRNPHAVRGVRKQRRPRVPLLGRVPRVQQSGAARHELLRVVRAGGGRRCSRARRHGRPAGSASPAGRRAAGSPAASAGHSS